MAAGQGFDLGSIFRQFLYALKRLHVVVPLKAGVTPHLSRLAQDDGRGRHRLGPLSLLEVFHGEISLKDARSHPVALVMGSYTLYAGGGALELILQAGDHFLLEILAYEPPLELLEIRGVGRALVALCMSLLQGGQVPLVVVEARRELTLPLPFQGLDGFRLVLPTLIEREQFLSPLLYHSPLLCDLLKFKLREIRFSRDVLYVIGKDLHRCRGDEVKLLELGAYPVEVLVQVSP